MYSVITHQSPAQARRIFSLLARMADEGAWLYSTTFFDSAIEAYAEAREQPCAMSTYNLKFLSRILEEEGWQIEKRAGGRPFRAAHRLERRQAPHPGFSHHSGRKDCWASSLVRVRRLLRAVQRVPCTNPSVTAPITTLRRESPSNCAKSVASVGNSASCRARSSSP